MTDGNIVAAKKKLGDAVQRLCERRPGMHGTRTVYQASLYNTLLGDLAGTQGDARTPAKSIPPLWIDAVILLQIIDTKAAGWCGKPGTTPDRLEMLRDQAWRPQDTDHVTDIVRTVDGWCESIQHLIDPERVKHISAPCPQCDTAIVWRKDSAGETVRQPALKVVTETGCTCQACGTHWGPEYYLHLCRLLGFETPIGVLE